MVGKGLVWRYAAASVCSPHKKRLPDLDSVTDPDDFRLDPDLTIENVRIRILTYISFV
jgi:hypothetical protein